MRPCTGVSHVICTLWSSYMAWIRWTSWHPWNSEVPVLSQCLIYLNLRRNLTCSSFPLIGIVCAPFFGWRTGRGQAWIAWVCVRVRRFCWMGWSGRIRPRCRRHFRSRHWALPPLSSMEPSVFWAPSYMYLSMWSWSKMAGGCYCISSQASLNPRIFHFEPHLSDVCIGRSVYFAL